MSGEPKEQLPRMTAGEDPHTTIEDNTFVKPRADLPAVSDNTHRTVVLDQLARLKIKAATKQQPPASAGESGQTETQQATPSAELTPDQRRERAARIRNRTSNRRPVRRGF